ncbi:Tetraspanin-13 [Eumeta japonica]|uniref:Tetraspanin-13 n=1 Tax=Eumeta variegata TaxID=151549 RepID=A0A4C1W6B9_EUMVA|nr:Tetraspanin-13 [Eumeta japonica]
MLPLAKIQYMVILFLLFLAQFSIACACLAVNSEQQEMFAEQGWDKVNKDTKSQVQNKFLCCGFRNQTKPVNGTDKLPSCEEVNKKCTYAPICQPCIHELKETIDYAFKLVGGIGLFFSFTEVGWSHFEKTLDNVTMSHRTREAANALSLSHSTMIGLPRAQH